jgi:hypothetical protein
LATGARGDGREVSTTVKRRENWRRGALTGVGTWQPRGDGALMSGPDAERERLTGGTPRQRFFELKILPDENSTKQIARS